MGSIKKITTDKPFTVFSYEADKDYLIARLINFSGGSFASRAGYFGQQACEKYLKALTVQEEKIYLKTHDLRELINYCSKYDQIFSDKKLIANMEIFDDFREVGRYGGESFHDPHAQKNENLETAGVYFWTDTNIKILDEIVGIIRKKLDFQETKSNDFLEAIIKDEKGNYAVDAWKLPIPLKAILTSNNDVFNC